MHCYDGNICKHDAKKIALIIIDFYSNHINIDKKYSNFIDVINVDEYIYSKSRLGWCYGDLSIAYTLYQAGVTFQDSRTVESAITILLQSTKRRSVEDTYIRDAGICHGSSGVAHIYNRLWHKTKNIIFKDACDYWILKTLEFSCHIDGIAGYKKYSPIKQRFEAELGLLEGTTGIGLVLLSYLTGDFTWDYSIMLDN